MSSIPSVKQKLDQHLKDNWSITEIAFDNDSYKKGSDPWIRAVLVPSYSQNADLQRLERHYGIYIISVFVPLKSGTGTAYAYAETIRNLFSNQDIDDIICYAAEIRRIGDDKNGWYMLNVFVNFWTDQ